MKILLTTVTTLIFSWSASARDIVAFHGLNQSIRSDVVVKPTDCTAGLVNHEDHQFIENSIPSVDAAFKLGATIGHINLRKTADNKLAVFHFLHENRKRRDNPLKNSDRDFPYFRVLLKCEFLRYKHRLH